MGSIGAVVGPGAEESRLRRLLTASAHRGSLTTVLAVPGGLLGTSNHADHSDAWSYQGAAGGAVIHGDVDNAAEIAASLDFDAGPDTEPLNPAQVVHHLMAQRGTGHLSRLRGAFAGIVVDHDNVMWFRDHLGFRPLFYRFDGATLLCATEAKQVVAGAGLSREPDLDALRVVYFNGISTSSSVKGVDRLMYGEVATLGASGVTRQRYWEPDGLVETAKVTLDEAVATIVELLDQAVRRSMTGADAIALSGGIDSPTIAAFAAPAAHSSADMLLSAYTFVYPDHRSVDESSYTREVARFLDLPLSEAVLRSGPLDDLAFWVDLCDGPWDTLPISWAVEGYRKARELGARSIMYGDIAEYVFTIRAGLLGHLALHGRWGALANQLSSRRARGWQRSALVKELARDILPTALLNAVYRRTGRMTHHYPAWVDPGAVGVPRYRTGSMHRPRDRWREAQISAVRGTTTTIEANEISAEYAGVQIRRPLADIDLWEYFLSLPAEIKFPDAVPKSLVRMAMRGRLPDVILDRTDKTVFDEHMVDQAQIDRIKGLINPATYRMDGVDYDQLLARFDAAAVTPNDVIWAHDLAKTHAFVDLFQ